MNLNIIPNGAIKRVHLSQNDVGRTLTFELFNGSSQYTIPVGATVKIQGTKPSGFGFSETCTVSGNTVTIDTTEEMTDEFGYIDTELQIKYNGNTIGTSNFVLAVEKNPHPDTTTDGSMETIIPELTLLVNEVKGYAEEIEGTYHAYGSPWVASTVAQMTDTDKIYVYTGSESGYTNGNWYYYNGSSWESGGVYNSVAVNIDDTLTIQGACADAKAVGDQVGILRSDLTTFEDGEYQHLKGTFQNGSLISGVFHPEQNWRVAETDIISYDRDITLIIESGYRIGVHTFVNGTFSSDSGWQTGTYKIPANTTFKMVIAKTTENQSSIANVVAFKSAVKFQSLININTENISSMSEVSTKNLSPTANAVTTNGGYLNGSTGTFGTVVSGKTYTFSAYNESDKTYGVTIRVNNGGWQTQTVVNPIANTRFSVTFTANTNGDISLSASYDKDYNPLFSEIQLEEGSTATDYIPYHQLIAIDLVARNEATKPSSKFSNVISVGHQGYDGYGAPYNTLQAFSDAKEYGFEWIETDIKMTLDRVPVITHDETRTTIGGQTVVIAETTYAELMTYQFYADASIKIPTLWETMNLCNEIGLGMFIEFKGYDFTLEEVETIINKAKRSTMQFAFSGWSDGPLVSVRTIDESLTVLKNLSSVPTISDLKTSSDYAQLRTLLSQDGRTCIYCDIPSGTSDNWFEELLGLGYSFVIGNNDSTDIIKSHLKYAFALTNTRTVRDVLE